MSAARFIDGDELEILHSFDFKDFKIPRNGEHGPAEVLACRGYLVRDRKVAPLPKTLPENSPINSLQVVIGNALYDRAHVCLYRLSRRGMDAIGRVYLKKASPVVTKPENLNEIPEIAGDY